MNPNQKHFLLIATWSIFLGIFPTHLKSTTHNEALIYNEEKRSSSPPYASIWAEDFAGLSDGTTNDSGTTSWTSTITQGTFEVRNGLVLFQGDNAGSNATWVSEEIDISNHTDISISYMVGDTGDAEKETSDSVRGYYILNNGSRVQFSNVTDDVPTPLLQSISGLNGNTVRIEIDFRVSYGNETYTIDDILVQGTSTSDSQAPTAPGSLSGTAASSSSIDLSWTASSDNVGVTGYKVYQDNVQIASNWGSTSYTVNGLMAATSYGFKVRASDAAGNDSPDSNSISVTTNSESTGGGGTSVWSEANTTASYNGEVAIGRATVPNGYKLAVEGHVRAREVRVDQENWPDYVFKEGYDLPTLEEIQEHIQEKGHLPNIPSATEVEANGVQLGEMDRLLLEKIEQLTLYVIQLKKENNQQQRTIEKLLNEYKSLEKR